ncbi:Hypothetical predicted protein [Paramuricea clavata]|uniref:Uncharacterized protein n=1 Tax=Paramuricea clavata TaxID=317549 RepID=A0A7D9HVQ6_PARCT|nr:Hypothetical predicted protein [Paramuricea clavata]
MFSFLYKRRDHGKFFLQPGNGEYGEIRIIVTTQYRPTTNFPSIIKYKYLFDPMPINESVNLLNKVSNIQNDDKNASRLAEALGGLPKSLADAACYIQADRRFNSTYYFYLKQLELNQKKYENDVNFTWAKGVEEGLSYNLTTYTASIMLIQQHISNGSSDDHFYLDLACFVGYCGSSVISIKFLENYVGLNDDLKDYTETQIKILVRQTSIYTK